MTWIGTTPSRWRNRSSTEHVAQRFLLQFGPGMHSYALQVEDLDSTIAHLDGGGVTVGVRPSKGFCFTDPRTTGGLLFEWSEFTVEEDPRLRARAPHFGHRAAFLTYRRTHLLERWCRNPMSGPRSSDRCSD